MKNLTISSYLYAFAFFILCNLIIPMNSIAHSQEYNPRNVLIEYCDGSVVTRNGRERNNYKEPKCLCIASKLNNSANEEMIKRVYKSLLPVGNGGTMYSPLIQEDYQKLRLANQVCEKDTVGATAETEKESWLEISQNYCGGEARLTNSPNSEFCKCFANKISRYLDSHIIHAMTQAIADGSSQAYVPMGTYKYREAQAIQTCQR